MTNMSFLKKKEINKIKKLNKSKKKKKIIGKYNQNYEN